jgi:hypothetical protein
MTADQEAWWLAHAPSSLVTGGRSMTADQEAWWLGHAPDEMTFLSETMSEDRDRYWVDHAPASVVPTPPADGLVAFWRLDETSGQRRDSFGTSHLTSQNNVGSTSKGSPAPENIPSTVANSVAASNQYLSRSMPTGNADSISWGRVFSLELWLKPLTTIATQTQMIGDVNGSTMTAYISIYGTGGTLATAPYYNGGWRQTGDVSIAVGSWNHLVVTNDGSRVYLYANGVRSTAGPVGFPSSTVASTFFIGAGYGAARDCHVSRVVKWNGVVLSQYQVTTLYNGGAGAVYPL